ncbi:hypothetical protein JQC91_03225 [Jannaschia sp. Os4]|uniref:hypothetical protein n=1 Tax=Jannaschia sp. Os4 TaxID=2807617 RepID=UPI00193A64C8|nr:hypothetical protein [Jannaschia sp. Os4]MBM2575308.1 hypothetical protein [Jannaschia sp. Os4]
MALPLVVVGAVGMGVASILPPSLDRKTTEHPSVAAMDEAARSWVPGWVPHGAERIRLVRDIDTNEVWIAFALSRRWEPPEGCALDDEALGRVRSGGTRDRSLWQGVPRWCAPDGSAVLLGPDRTGRWRGYAAGDAVFAG